MRSFSEVRPVLPIDLPLVRRLSAQGLSFDSATSLTRGTHSLEGAVWSAVPLTDLGTPTFVLRDGDNAYVAQFRHRGGSPHAHITFFAPAAELCTDTPWLGLIDAMTQAAGRRGALTLNAEAAENSEAFAILRQAGFAVYARQEIWRRLPGPLPTGTPDVLRPETDQDAWSITCLYNNVVPRLVWQADAPPDTGHGGLVYEQNGQVLAYISVQEGKCGLYIQSLLHPDTYSQARAILASVLTRLPRAERLPVYVPVRRFQEWLGSSLIDSGFDPWTAQAVMVKHTVARVEHPVFRPAHTLEGVIHARTRIIEYWNNNLYQAQDEAPAKEVVNGISHHRRSGKAQSSPPSVPGRLA